MAQRPRAATRPSASCASRAACGAGNGAGKKAGRGGGTAMVWDEAAVFEHELRAVLNRRRSLGVVAHSGHGINLTDVRELPDTVGVACSGGGIRAAAYASGALTALSARGVLPRVDCISCVSGGGYAATAFATHVQALVHTAGAGARGPDSGSQVEWASQNVREEYESAATSLVARMTANSSYLVHRSCARGGHSRASAVRQPKCRTTCADVTSLALAMVGMLAGVPLLVGAAAVLLAEAANQLLGHKLRPLLSTPTLAGVMQWFGTEVWVSLALVLAAGCVCVATRRWAAHGRLSTQAYHHASTLILVVLTSLWASLGFMLLDERLSATQGDELFEAAILMVVAAAGIGAAVGIVPLSSTVFVGACAAAPVSVLWTLARVTSLSVQSNGIGTVGVGAAAAIVVTSTACFDAVVTRLHSYYRRRLLRAFYYRGEDMPLRCLDLKRSPLVLCNTVMNDFVRHSGQARCAPFVMSPLFCGGPRTGYCVTPPSLRMSEVMAVSGAAVAVAMGNADPDGRLRFLLGLLGISLGKWFPLTAGGGASDHARPGDNPFGDDTVAQPTSCSRFAASVRVGLVVVLGLAACTLHRYLVVVVAASTAAVVVASLLPPFRWLLHTGVIRHLHQILGVVHVGASPPYVFLSDGGHLDNLGIIELLKRRCVHIVAFDAGHDPAGTCEDLLTAIRYAQTRLGCSFLPPAGVAGDYVRCVNAFIADPSLRLLQLRVQYFESQLPGSLGQTHDESGLDSSSPTGMAGAGVGSPVDGNSGASAASSRLGLPRSVVKEGTLLYVKSRVTGMDTDLCSATPAGRAADAFPHHSTTNQFFPPALFQRYAELGRRGATCAAEALVQLAAGAHL